MTGAQTPLPLIVIRQGTHIYSPSSEGTGEPYPDGYHRSYHEHYLPIQECRKAPCHALPTLVNPGDLASCM